MKSVSITNQPAICAAAAKSILNELRLATGNNNLRLGSHNSVCNPNVATDEFTILSEEGANNKRGRGFSYLKIELKVNKVNVTKITVSMNAHCPYSDNQIIDALNRVNELSKANCNVVHTLYTTDEAFDSEI